MVAANLSLLKSDVKSWMFARDYQGDWGMREHCVHLAATVHKPGRLKELKLLKKNTRKKEKKRSIPPKTWFVKKFFTCVPNDWNK